MKIIASLSGNAIIINQNKIPIAMEFNNDTLVASFAPFPFPAPSSFATRTLCRRRNEFNAPTKKNTQLSPQLAFCLIT